MPKKNNPTEDELEEDTDYTDEQGGGGDLTEEEFDDALYKATRKLEDEEEDAEPK